MKLLFNNKEPEESKNGVTTGRTENGEHNTTLSLKDWQVITNYIEEVEGLELSRVNTIFTTTEEADGFFDIHLYYENKSLGVIAKYVGIYGISGGLK